MGAAVVELRRVAKRFGERVAVDGLDLDVPAGLCFGLLGPNGAGKTTTLRMIYGATPPSSGSVRVFGLDVGRETRAVRARLGVTLQENALIEALSPVENLRVFARYHLLSRAQSEPRIEEILDFLELRSHAGVPVERLSGGFKRRLAIGLSLVSRPELLILDEPTTGLDPAVRLSLWERVRAEGEPARLIRETLAPEALELELPPAEEAALLGDLAALPRLRSGRRVALYVDDAGALLGELRRRRSGDGGGHLAAVVRPTNLEDVFLRITGTSLEA